MNLNIFLGLSAVTIYSILCNGNFMKQLSRIEVKTISDENSSKTMLRDNENSPYRMKRDANTSVEHRIAEEFKNVTNNETLEERKKLELFAEFKRLWPVERWREYGFFSDDYLELINVHWLQFPPPSAALQKTLGGLYFLFSTVGCWGNVIVLFMYCR